MQKHIAFIPWKEKVIKEVPIRELTPYIWREDSKSLQYGVILLINTIIRLCKGGTKGTVY
ncbi:hypothetical protein NQ317_016795 [Molorchus minor]|uniref:Uncharacterized protein n=1 Tax=Molorchus minor TaxID=1323400 RepID=A0ABQ9J3A4_9CUCU|nr:hypothetical protein NQ317_016795 [Molorchus minor]